MFRKLAREAVIFGLSGMVVASAASHFLLRPTANPPDRSRNGVIATPIPQTSRPTSAIFGQIAADPAYRILMKCAGVDESTKSQTWELYHQAKNETELEQKLNPISLPNDCKADLWDAKHSARSNRVVGGSDLSENATAPPKQADPARQILEDAKTLSNGQRADAWDAFHNAKDEDELVENLRSIELPSSVKHDLWEAKHSSLKNVEPDSREYVPDTPPLNPFGWVVAPEYPQFTSRQNWQQRCRLVGSAFLAGIIFGFPSGLGAWGLYRLVRFAILG